MSQEYSVKDIVEQFQKGSIEQINLDQKNGRTITQSQAGTEAESSKDYTGRIAYEFFQNAVDRADRQIWMELTKDTFIISNDGKPFSIYKSQEQEKKSDFHSLNNIHNGEKVAGESIGNKGVGFKSCWNVSEHVKIESIINKDNDTEAEEAWGFELFNPVTAKQFDEKSIKEAIEKAGGKVPSFYFPKYIESKKENFINGAVTKIAIFLKDTVAYDEIKQELEEFKKTKFLFLNLLKGKEEKKYRINITIDNDDKGNLLYSEDDTWHKITLKKQYEDDFYRLKSAREKENYKNIPDEPNIAIAFPPDNDKPIESKFYTYLPTKIECGFNVLIHADFALDNARISIPDNDYNNTILEIAAKIFVNELLNNTTLHGYQNFALFLMPTNKNDKFAKLVWEELIKDNKLTQILKKVYTKDRNFPQESYENIFNVMLAWHKDKVRKTWGDHYNEIYSEIIKYFCDKDILIVWIDENNISYLPKKEENTSLFFIQSLKKDTSLNYDLLSNIEAIKLSSFESIKHDVFSHNKIVKKFSTLEILKVLQKYEHKNIILFVKQLLETTKEELSQDVKKFLLDIKIPINEEFVEVKKCFIKLDKEIQELFTDEFKELDIEKLDGIDVEFLTKIGVANNRLPFYKDKKEIVLPFETNTTNLKSNTMKDLVSNTLFDDEVIEKLSTLEWFYDERKAKLYSPKEVFLFKEHDNRKIECIAQEKKDKKYQALYNRFNIDEIDETTDSKKLINQLKQMKHTTIDTFHQEIYKKVTYALSKIDNIEDDNIPILAFNKEENIYQYLEDEKKEAIFLETKYKKYKNNIEEKFIVLFDTNMKKEFIKKVNIKIFEADYKIIYEPERSKKEDRKTKENIQKTFLPIFLCIADEIMGSSFEKEDILKRWENLSIYKADDVQLSLNDGKIIESTKGSDIDVLFVPIKDRNKNIYNIGNIAHDLQKPLENNNFIKFGRVIADGVFRNLKLTPYFESYISRYLLKDEKSKENYLLELGIEQVNIEEMKNFIKKNLLTQDEKDKILQILREIGLKIEQFQDIFDFQNYENIDINFEDFKSKFDDKYQFIAQNLIDTYKLYYQSKVEKIIQSNKKELEVLCFIQHKKREYFENKSQEIKYKRMTVFQQEFNIFKLFHVEKIDIKSEKSDQYVKGMLDLEYHTDEIKAKKLNLKRKTATLEAKTNPLTGDAKQSKQKTKEQEEKLEKRGLGQELKVAYEYAKKVDKKAFIRTIKEQIFIDDAALKINTNLQKYIDALDTYKETDNLTFARKVIQIASNKLDGLGYDLIIPNEKNNILKVELKSTTQSDNIEVHFSKNEIERIMHYMKVDNYRIWLNNEMNDITKQIKDAVSELEGLNLSFYSKDYILTLGTTK